MKERKPIYIKCPRCGREYTPAEIFIPDAFFGRPTTIERDANTGKITNFYGRDMDLSEQYICDKCDTPFKINTKLQFITTENTKYNFNEDYKTSLKPQTLFLSEE